MSEKSSEKRDSFVRLAEKRVERAVRDVELIGNLSNTSSYEYSDKDVAAIFRALDEAIKSSKQRFSDGLNRRKRFTLSN